jgi:hypothetical protein
MRTPTAILLGALAIAAVLAFLFRWEIVIREGRGYQNVFRLDRWTGAIVPCEQQVPGGPYVCEFAPAGP